MHRFAAISVATVLSAAGVILTGLAMVASCNGPTDARVIIATEFDCAPGMVTEVYASTPDVYGSLPTPSLVTRECSNRLVGDLVLTPQSDQEREAEIGVRVVTRLVPGAACTPGDANCIVAKRRFRYREHESVTLSILMSRACAGVDCPGDQTCVLGRCESAFCEGNQCDKERGDAGGSRVEPGASGPDDAAPVDSGSSIVQAGGDICSGRIEQVVVEPDRIVNLSAIGSELYWLTEAGRLRTSTTRGSMVRTIALPSDAGARPLASGFGLGVASDRVVFMTREGLFRVPRDGGAFQPTGLAALEAPLGVAGNGAIAYFSATERDGGADAGARLVSSMGGALLVSDQPSLLVAITQGHDITGSANGIRSVHFGESLELDHAKPERLAGRERADGRVDVCFLASEPDRLACTGVDDGGALPSVSYATPIAPNDLVVMKNSVVYSFAGANGVTGLARAPLPGLGASEGTPFATFPRGDDTDVRVVAAAGNCVFFVRGRGTILRVALPP